MSTTGRMLIDLFGSAMGAPMLSFLESLTEPTPKRGRPARVFPTPGAFLKGMRDLRTRLLAAGAGFTQGNAATLLGERFGRVVRPSEVARWATAAGFPSWDSLAATLEAEGGCPSCGRSLALLLVRDDAGRITRHIFECAPCNWRRSEKLEEAGIL